MSAPNPVAELNEALAILARCMVEKPEEIRIEIATTGSLTTFTVFAAPADFEQLIGFNGKNARALRVVFRAAAKKFGHSVMIELHPTPDA